MEKDTMDYFLFPGLVLPEKDFRNLFVFLPRLGVLEISRRAAIPEYAGGKFLGRPAIADPELMENVRTCVQGYSAFAQVHGGSGGTLGYLSRAFDDMSDTRFKIQEELRGKCPGLDPEHAETVRAAAFLEIARELDEKEFELESNLARADALGKEFSEILGITEEDEAMELPESPDQPLAAESPGPLYMLSERIESWVRLFSVKPLGSMPVFVASSPEAAAEVLDMLRTGCGRGGKEFVSAGYSLGSFPRLDQLGQKQFRSLVEAPGAPPLLAAYRERLDQFLQAAASGKDPDELEAEAESLRQCLEKFCKLCSIPGPNRVSLSLEMPRGLSLDEALGILSRGGRAAPPATPEAPKAPERPALFLTLD